MSFACNELCVHAIELDAVTWQHRLHLFLDLANGHGQDTIAVCIRSCKQAKARGLALIHNLTNNEFGAGEWIRSPILLQAKGPNKVSPILKAPVLTKHVAHKRACQIR